MLGVLEYIKDKLNINSANTPKTPLRIRDNSSAVFDYNYMMALNKKDYAKHLCEAYLMKTGQKLNLKHPKTLNEKIQWLKIYDNIPVKAQLTDKILVRDRVKEKIGEEYLKPVLWIGDKFDDIPFDTLPNAFIVKTNHGCKWQYAVKNKEKYLQNTRLFNTTKTFMENWLIQSFFGWSDFETQYIDIKPRIIIEPLLQEPSGEKPQEIEIWCFNGSPKILQKLKYEDSSKLHYYHTYDENFNNININFLKEYLYFESEADDNLKKAVELSKTLAKGFKLARIDWLVSQNKLYFGEITFTPLSGFISFSEDHSYWQRELGNMLDLKGD